MNKPIKVIKTDAWTALIIVSITLASLLMTNHYKTGHYHKIQSQKMWKEISENSKKMTVVSSSQIPHNAFGASENDF